MYNLSKIEELSGGDKDFIASVVALFVEEVPADLAAIANGIDTADFQKVYQFAHKIKPNVDLVGLDEAFQHILAIEQSAKQEQMPAVKEHYAVIESQVNAAIVELKKDFQL